MKQRYRHLFFDLDRTLYDFENNNRQTLQSLFCQYNLEGQGISCFDAFYSTYLKINYGLWQQYKKREITKEILNHSRFLQTLAAFNITNGLAEVFAREYITLSPLQTRVLPGTFEILDYLLPRYSLHIITNGFEEIQYEKLRRCGLQSYFSQVITSEKAGAQKPHQLIFSHALQQAGASLQESLIIGDDPETDILGGIDFGMDQVWLRQAGESSHYQATYTIGCLLELKNIL